MASQLGDRDEIMAWLRERNSPLAMTDPGPEALLGHEVNTHPPVELDTLIEKSQPPHVLETE